MAIVATTDGKLEGLEHDGIHSFLGVRFAAPPTGDRRFLAPQPVEAWDGVRPATAYGNRAIQGPLPEGMNLEELMGPEAPGDQDEDMLFLNLWTPGLDDARRPVVVWIHGGSLQFGSANDYPGHVWAAQDDIVYVSIAYRLGILGFVDCSGCGPEFAGSANNGIRDQIAALAWIRDNVAAFGGDPGNVTVIGQSAGASSVLALLAAPAADGLFHKAVACSPGGVMDPPADPIAGISAMRGIGPDAVIDDLRAMPAAELVAFGSPFVPGACTVDGTVVTRSIHAAIAERGEAGVPLIAGVNTDEHAGFTANPVIAQMALAIGPQLAGTVAGAERGPAYYAGLEAAFPDDTPLDRVNRLFDDLFLRSALTSTEAATAAGAGGWLYRFDVPATDGVNKGKTNHGVEVHFTINAFAAGHDVPDWSSAREAAAGVATNWSRTLAAFARTGDPNGAGLPEWPRYDAATRRSLLVSRTPVVEENVGASSRALWG